MRPAQRFDVQASQALHSVRMLAQQAPPLTVSRPLRQHQQAVQRSRRALALHRQDRRRVELFIIETQLPTSISVVPVAGGVVIMGGTLGSSSTGSCSG